MKGSKTKNTTYNDLGRVPPQNQEVEKIILGVCLVNLDAFGELKDIIKSVDVFYKEDHQLMWKAMSELFYEEKPIDLTTVITKLEDNGKLEELGGHYGVVKFTSEITPHHNINKDFYARILYESYIHREVIHISDEMARMSFNKVDVSEILQYGEKHFKELTAVLEIESEDDVIKLIEKVNQYQYEVENEVVCHELKTSFESLKKIIRLTTDELILIAARKKHGKSSLIHAITLDLLKNNDNLAVMLWSMEDSAMDIIMHFRAIMTGITKEHQKQIKGLRLSPEHKKKLHEANEYVKTFVNRLDIVTEKKFIRDVGAHFNKFMQGQPEGTIGMLIVDNLSRTKDIGKRGNKDMYTAFFDAADSIDSLRGPDRIVFVLHHIKGSSELEIERGFRPETNSILYAERLSGVITQMILMNKISEWRELLDEERGRTKINYDGNIIDREKLLSKMIILEKTEDRSGDDSQENSIVRLWPVDLGKKWFPEWNPEEVYFTSKETDIVERDIQEVSAEMFRDEMWDINPEGNFAKTLENINFYMSRKTFNDGSGESKNLTFDFLKRQYRNYVKAKRMKDFGRFTNSDDRIKNINDWILKDTWKDEYSVHEMANKKRDFYLYKIK